MTTASVDGVDEGMPGPDWHSIKEEIACPLCGYNLRGLANPRCPECGYAFEWAELLDATRRVHPYLFEHHPNPRGLLLTVLAGVWPWDFWAKVNPRQPPVLRRLVIYWFVTNVVAAGAMAATLAAAVWLAIVMRPYLGPPVWSEVFAGLSYQFGSERHAVGFAALVWAWPWATCLAMSRLSVSLRRASVRPVHVVRCTVYCGDTLAWVAAPWCVMTLCVVVLEGMFACGGRLTEAWLDALNPQSVALAVWGIGTARLTVAYRKYLRFPRPRSTVLVMQFVVALAAFIALMNHPAVEWWVVWVVNLLREAWRGM